MKNVGDTSFEEGKAEGIEEGKAAKTLEIAKALLEKGFDMKSVSDITGLSLETISNI